MFVSLLPCKEHSNSLDWVDLSEKAHGCDRARAIVLWVVNTMWFTVRWMSCRCRHEDIILGYFWCRANLERAQAVSFRLRRDTSGGLLTVQSPGMVAWGVGMGGTVFGTVTISYEYSFQLCCCPSLILV